MVNEGDLVLCTVSRIEHTTVFVTLPTGELGTLVLSEIAPGRIKNIREYVVPNKKIVCKVIRVSGNNIDLSLRRVSSKERSDVMSKYKQEQTAKAAFNQILKEKSKEVVDKISKDFSLSDFLFKAKENEALISKYIPKEFQETIKKITQKKQKDIEVKKMIKLKCQESDGILRIKKILSVKDEKVNVNYLAAGNFQILIKSENYKEANKKMDALISKIQQFSKQNQCEFETDE